ncbi:amidohydrolase [Thalassobacillus pellis]|uniref:amidohydrolase n=1 Tax=Thalassobacillus pellis TaxID=748008 RepID=UPI001960E597|nr:amidohydrolase [Thalassobacillus pellis]MBM7554951.1 putative amidohydrolase YtcJ [Thalassobacillus pellis]
MAKLWYGGKIYTMEKEGEWVEAVVTENGKILDVGDTQELYRTYKDTLTDEHELKGHVMYPGFVDSHLHIIGHGERLLRLDLSFMKSAEEVKWALSQHAEKLEEGEWIIGDGWNENQWEDTRIIHKNELDEITTKHPMMLTRVCRHAVLANSKAMELAGVTPSTPDPQGGVIARSENGEPIGYFHEKAQELIKQAMPEVTPQYLEHAVQLAVNDMHMHGLVGGHSEDLNYYGGFKKTFDAFTEIIDGKKLKFRANLLVHHEVVEDMHDHGLSYKSGTEFVELGAMKIFSDGALGGRTAWLSEPYTDDPMNRGVAIHEQSNLEKLVKKARAKNMPVAVHAIGDQAVDATIQAIKKYPLPSGERDRIIHAQILREDLYYRLKEVNAILDLQPTFVSSDFPWVIDRLGEKRLKNSYAWKTLLEKGIPCAGGSDAPIEEINPLLGIRAAVERRASYDQQIYTKEEQLSMFEAISLYTKGSAYAIRHEHDRGKIAKGYVADFTVLDRDLFSLAPHEIVDTNVSMTVVDEELMYQRI